MFKTTHWASKNCPLLKRTVQVPIFIVLFFKLIEYCGTPQYNQILANTLKLVLFHYYFFENRKKGNLWMGKDTTKVKTANSKTTLGRGKF